MDKHALELLSARTRRHFLRDSALGLGGVALSMLGGDISQAATAGASAEVDPFLPKQTHFAPRAKNVIFLSMSGGPPHLDLFDYKPELVSRDGQDCPESLTKGKQFAFTSGTPKLLGTRAEIQPARPKRRLDLRRPAASGLRGRRPARSSSLAGPSSSITVPPNCCSTPASPARKAALRSARGLLMAWVPKAAICPATSCSSPAARCRAPAKLPGAAASCSSVYQGVQCRTGGDPVLYLSNPEGMDRTLRRLSFDALARIERD